MRCTALVCRGISLEVAVLGISLLLFTATAYAQQMTGNLRDDFMMMVDRGLWIAVALSVFGGLVGLLGRLRDPEWMESAKKSSLAISIAGEMTFSIFTGILILFYGTDKGFSNYTVISAILVGSWLGTKMGRLLLSYITSNREKLASLIAGGAKNG